MALHFTREEFAERQKCACEEMAKAALDGLLIFRQESMYYLTGYDTSGYSMFQGMYLGADGALALLTRSADQRQARLTSVIDDIRIWTDAAGFQAAANKFTVDATAVMNAADGPALQAAITTLHAFCAREVSS